MDRQANKWQSLTMLKQRILTALVLTTIVLWAVFGLSDNQLLFLFGVVLFGGAWEWSALAELHTKLAMVLFVLVQTGLLILCWWLVVSDSGIVRIVLVASFFAWLVILYCLAMYERGKLKIHFSQSFRVLLGFLLLPIALLSLAFILMRFDNDRELILMLFFLVWGADVAAYFTGKKWGKNKLAPKISPGKSWQGVAGALLMTVLISCVAWWQMNYPVSLLPKLIVLSLVVVILSIVGDLFESLLKRQSGVKDSSHLLPGHGGVLDRIDSMIAASPAFALGIYLLDVS